jgi:hypothetical protein
LKPKLCHRQLSITGIFKADLQRLQSFEDNDAGHRGWLVTGLVDCSTSTVAPPDLLPPSRLSDSPPARNDVGLSLSLYASPALCHFLFDCSQPTSPGRGFELTDGDLGEQ